MNERVTHKRLHLLFLMASLPAIGSLCAGSEDYTDEKDYSKEIAPAPQSWCETPPLWEVRIGVPGWLAGLSGESGVKGVVSNVDVSFDQLLRHLTHFPVALSIDARYGRWDFYAVGQYIEVVRLRPCLGYCLPMPMCISRTRLQNGTFGTE